MVMEFPKPSRNSNPLHAFSSFIQQHCHRLGAELTNHLEETKRLARTVAGNLHPVSGRHLGFSLPLPPFASLTQLKPALAASLSSDHVAKALTGTSVYTVSNSNNEFVLISDPNGTKSIGLLCFRHEDAEAYLAQVKLRKRELRSNAKIVPITLDQVYMLKVEGIAFRFLPDPVQIKNALELKASDLKSGFDGVPVFQSDLLVSKKKNKRYCPVYFTKEDIAKDLSMVSRTSRVPGVSQHIMVGSLEDVLRKMETSQKNSGWEDLIFIPPGKSYSQHIKDVTKS